MANFGFTAPRQMSNQHASALRANASVTALVVHTVDANGNSVLLAGGSTQISVREILTSSGASVIDSTVNAIGVTIRAGSLAGTEYTDGDIDATVSGGALLFDNSSNTLRAVSATLGLPVNIVGGAAGGSSQVSIKEMLTSSGGSVMDGTNVAIRVNVVAGSAGGSTDVTVTPAAGSTFRTQPGSTAWASSAGFHFDSSGALAVKEQAPSTGPFAISSVGGIVTVSTGPFAVSSIAGVTSVAPMSTNWASSAGFHFDSSGALTVKEQAPSTGPIVISSVGGIVTVSTGPVVISSVGGIVTVSTGPVAISSIAGVSIVRPEAGSTFNTRPLQSSQADLRATVYQSSATEFKVSVFDSTGGGVIGSTKAINLGANGILVRPGSVDSTSAAGLITAAGDTSMISSVAAQSIYVYALLLQGGVGNSTVSPTAGSSYVVMRVQSGSTGAVLWRWTYQASTNSAPCMTIAVTPPGYLFKTAAAANLNLSATSSGGNFAVSAWRE